MKLDFSGNRRTFIKNVAALGGFAFLLGLGKPAAAKENQPLPQPKLPSKGYQLTEHIKKYYETART